MSNETAAPAPAPATPGLTAAGLAAGGGALFCWTVTPLFVEYLTGHFDLWASNGWRYGLAALMWLPYLVWMLARRRVPASLWRRALLPAFFSTVAQIAFVAAFYYTGPAQLTFGLRMQIVATAIGAAILFPAELEVIRRSTFLVGALAVLAGVGGVAAFSQGAVETVETDHDGTLRLTARHDVAVIHAHHHAGDRLAIHIEGQTLAARLAFLPHVLQRVGGGPGDLGQHQGHQAGG